MTESERVSQHRKKNYRTYQFYLVKKNDGDLITYLDSSPNRTALIKKALNAQLRADLKPKSKQ